MKILNTRVFLAAVIYLHCATRSHAQDMTPLAAAVHCLTIKHFLPQSAMKAITFGYLADGQSYPGKRMLYVLEYDARSRANGSVFTMFVSEQGGRQVFNIQNNAQFKMSIDRDEGVIFVSPPLGGTWTQQHLLSAIKRIEKLPRSSISSTDIRAVIHTTSCKSYTDTQSQPATK